MDWNKTKTIFIIVFSVLNVFLYSLYTDRYTEAQNIQAIGETSIEESLEQDNITYGELPVHQKESSYMSAEISAFTKDDLDQFQNQMFEVLNETDLISTFKVPVNIRNGKGDYRFSQFLSEHVPRGEEYVLWEVDEKNRQALFFQNVKKNPIYFNENAMLIVHWNEDEYITTYEQRIFEKFFIYNEKKDLLPPMQAISTLYSRSYLKRDSIIRSMQLGYSTLIPGTKMQVFAPTWHVHVELKDGESKDYFINAIDGKVIEFSAELMKEDNE